MTKIVTIDVFTMYIDVISYFKLACMMIVLVKLESKSKLYQHVNLSSVVETVTI